MEEGEAKDGRRGTDGLSAQIGIVQTAIDAMWAQCFLGALFAVAVDGVSLASYRIGSLVHVHCAGVLCRG